MRKETMPSDEELIRLARREYDRAYFRDPLKGKERRAKRAEAVRRCRLKKGREIYLKRAGTFQERE